MIEITGPKCEAIWDSCKERRFVSLDALHTQDETARAAVIEEGAHFLLTVKGNQPTIKENIEKLVPAPDADFSPSRADADPIPHSGNQQKPN